MKRVFVTGLGVVSGIGIGVEKNIAALKAGKHGMKRVTLFSTDLDVPVSEVKRSNDRLRQLLRLKPDNTYSRTTLLGMMAVKEALKDAQISPKQFYMGLVSATSVGGMDQSEQFYAAFKENPEKGRLRDVISHDCAASTEIISSYINAVGYATTISTACSSAANAIIHGARLISHGDLDTVVVGGTDALCRFTLNGFNSLMILDEKHCRPFDESCAGLNLGEGAGYLVLQAEGACQRTPYCELTGYANANDAYHQTGSSPEGDGPYLCMSQAIAMSGIDAKKIGYINVHGTGTPGNDASESRALQRIFGEHVPPFSSVKPFIGHTLGASQAIEAVYAALAISKGMIYPNLNFKQAMGTTGLIPETTFKEGLSIKHVLCNSFGFGGNDTSLLFSAARPLRAKREELLENYWCKPRFKKEAYITSTASIHPKQAVEGNSYLVADEPDYKSIILDANLRRRMSRIIKMGVACGTTCLGTTPPESIQGIITATGLGCLTDTEKFMNAIIDREERLLNPTPFIQSTFNTVGAQIAQLHQIRTYNMTFSHRALSFESALIDAMMKIDEGHDNLLVGAVDEVTPISHAIQQRLGLLKGVQAGEGAQFFLLSNKPNSTTSAKICDIDTYFLPPPPYNKWFRPELFSSPMAVGTHIRLMLIRNRLDFKKVDWFVTGENGSKEQEALYDKVYKYYFPHAKRSSFKDECGEYPTAMAYALHQVAVALEDPEHPAKIVVICNNYHHNDHSAILIKKHRP